MTKYKHSFHRPILGLTLGLLAGLASTGCEDIHAALNSAPLNPRGPRPCKPPPDTRLDSPPKDCDFPAPVKQMHL